MTKESGYKLTLLIPLLDNAGGRFDAGTWLWWHHSLSSIVTGFTDMGMVRGWWRGYSDRHRHFTIVVSAMHEVDGIRELLREARSRFGQEAMYFEYHPVHFEEVR
jgi:hypothetical protein